MTLLRDRRLTPIQTPPPDWPAVIAVIGFALLVSAIFLGAMAVIAWLAPAAPQPQRFTAPPFTLDFAAVSR